jgi:hypothetical protein
MAISAFVQLVDIWVNKPTTRDTIILSSGKLLGGFLSLLAQLVPYVAIIAAIVIIFKIIILIVI